MERAEKGFSLVESMLVIGIAAILMGVLVPNLTGFIKNSRRNGAAEQIAGDARKARARAITTGWQYRVYGFNAGASSAYRNMYRIIGRSSSGVAWPADSAAPAVTATLNIGPWVNMAKLYPGVSLNPSDGTDHFWVGFDSRGVRFEIDPSFDPLYVTNQGQVSSMTVSAVGSVDIQ